MCYHQQWLPKHSRSWIKLERSPAAGDLSPPRVRPCRAHQEDTPRRSEGCQDIGTATAGPIRRKQRTDLTHKSEHSHLHCCAGASHCAMPYQGGLPFVIRHMPDCLCTTTPPGVEALPTEERCHPLQRPHRRACQGPLISFASLCPFRPSGANRKWIRIRPRSWLSAMPLLPTQRFALAPLHACLLATQAPAEPSADLQ